MPDIPIVIDETATGGQEQLPLPFIARADLPPEASDYILCPHCDNSDHTELVHCEDSDEDVCPDCGRQCEGRCEEYYLADGDEISEGYLNMSYRRSSQTRGWLCNHCSFVCEDCGDRYSDSCETYENSGGERICEQCSEHYTSCENCNETINLDSAYSSNDGQCTLCESCHDAEEEEEEEDTPRTLNSYSFKPKAKFYGTPPANKRYYGIELEVDHRGTNNKIDDIRSASIPEAFYCKEDGSLINGFEIVSHPASFKWWMDADLGWMDRLKRKAYSSYNTTTCGIHIHVSRSSLSQLTIYKLLRFCNHNARFVLAISRRKAELLERWAKIGSPGTGGLAAKAKDVYNQCRYEAINLVPKRTIEFRIFRGTLCIDSFRRNLAFVHCLLAFVEQAGCNGLTVDAFVIWIKDNARAVLGKGELCKNFKAWINTCGGK